VDDPHDYVLFYEYFDGDTGRGLVNDWANLSGGLLYFLLGFLIASERRFLDLVSDSFPSRSSPYGQNAFTHEPSAIIGTSPGKIGTAFAQQHLRSGFLQLAADELRRGLHAAHAGAVRRRRRNVNS